MPIILHAKNIEVYGGGSAPIVGAFGGKFAPVMGAFDAVYWGDFWLYPFGGFSD